MSEPDSAVVRAERTDAATVGGGWCPDVEARMEATDRAVRTLLEPALDRLRGADDIVVVADARYPFHPSSGTVTDPAVVGSLLAQLRRETDASLSVAGESDERMAFERTAATLGYPAALERSEASLLDLSTVDDARVLGEVAADDIEIAVPEPLLEATVVVVPTLRPTREGPIAGAMRTLGRHATVVGGPGEESASDGRVADAITRAVEPALALLDATTAFAGEPHAAETLLAGEPAVVDAVGADLIDRSAADDEALTLALGPGETSIRVDGADAAALRAELPTGELPPPDDTHPAVSAAYGLYARVAGDAVPPQLEVDR